MNTKNNARYEATDAKIIQFFLQELENNTIEHIKVSTICDGIGINRSSFYAHYADVYDILEKLSMKVGESLIESFDAHSLSEAAIGTKESLIIVLEHIRENRAFYRAYFSSVSPEKINEHLDAIFEAHVAPFLDRLGVRAASEKHYYFLFFKAGLIEIIKEWLKYDCKDEAEVIAEIAFKATC